MKGEFLLFLLGLPWGLSMAAVAEGFARRLPAAAQRDPVPLVIMTHAATEGAARRATEEIEALPVVNGSVVRLRVKD